MANEKTRATVAFMTIDPYIERNIILPTEQEYSGRDWVEWGERNLYPEYILELSKTAPTLHSVIAGTVDYVAGDDATLSWPFIVDVLLNKMNRKGEQLSTQVRTVSEDIVTYGGFALQVIRSLAGKVVEVYRVPLRFLRSNKENTVFYYSEKWKEGRRKFVEYPAFMDFTDEQWATLTPEQRQRHLSSIYYYKQSTSQVYPEPLYCAAVKDCETERCISDYHLNAINNGFSSSAVINFNNGVPSDEIQEEIQKAVNEKFAGHTNAERILISFNDNKENGVTIDEFQGRDFGAKYKALSSHVRQQIFTSFRANPNIFGIPTESLGFSSEEYESSFKLFNRTVVRPMQRAICDAYNRILAQYGITVTIKPFSLDGDTETNVN